METYDAMRLFADSWGLVAMLLFFAAVVLRLFTARARKHADEAAQIPFKTYPDKDA